MGFLDNDSINIDAVLTTAGTAALAAGTFNITQFALGDDEINYELYDLTAAEGFEDVTLLETPILEAFTSGEGVLKSLLFSLDRQDVFYLSVMKPFEQSNWAPFTGATTGIKRYVVACDAETVKTIQGNTSLPEGVQDGVSFTNDHSIRVDQGIDTLNLLQSSRLEADQFETSYVIQMDNRLGEIIAPKGVQPSTLLKNFVDNDNIATYTAALGTDGTGGYVAKLIAPNTGITDGSVIKGPLGTRVNFRIKAADGLRTSNQLFNRFGSSTLDAIGSAGIGTLKQISTTVLVRGFQTGYRVPLAVDYVKKI